MTKPKQMKQFLIRTFRFQEFKPFSVQVNHVEQ